MMLILYHLNADCDISGILENHLECDKLEAKVSALILKTTSGITQA